jgi:hypothetical protein
VRLEWPSRDTGHRPTMLETLIERALYASRWLLAPL